MADFNKTTFGANIDILKSEITAAFAMGHLDKTVDAHIMGTTADICVALKFKEHKKWWDADNYEEVNSCLGKIAGILNSCETAKRAAPFGRYNQRIKELQGMLPIKKYERKYPDRWG